MENLLGPAITLAIWSGICGLDIAGPQFMLWRPLISGSVAGLLLGDLETGLIIAGGVELTWLVLVNIGGAAPPDVTVGGIVAVAVGVFQGTQDVGVAIAAATPVALIMQQLWSLAAIVNTAWIHRMDAAAEQGDIGAVERWHVFAGLGTWFVAYSLPVFAAVYFGIPVLDSVMETIPQSIIAGLGTASGLLPALGISMLLSQILTNVNWPYFLIGIALAAYLQLPVIGTAALAVSIAFVLYFGREVIEGLRASSAEGEAKAEGVLTAGDRRNMFFRSLTALATFNFERHLAGTFTFVMAPAIRKVFKTREEISDALSRHLLFYNVQPTLTTMVMGSTAAMEEELVANAPSSEEAEASKEAIIAYKAGIMGPLAGVGDSLIWFTLMPLTFAIGASMATEGNPAGPIVALLLFNIVNVPLKYAGIGMGYTRGIQFVEQLRAGLIENISNAATIVGLMVMGTALVNTVSVSTPIAIQLGEDAMEIQPVIDQVFPSLLTVLLTLLILYLLRKQWNPIVLLLLLLVFGVVGKALGILA